MEHLIYDEIAVRNLKQGDKEITKGDVLRQVSITREDAKWNNIRTKDTGLKYTLNKKAVADKPKADKAKKK